MVKVEQEATVEIEVQEVDNEDNPYRARVVGSDAWWSAPSVRGAVAGAANTATDAEIEAALGDLWNENHD